KLAKPARQQTVKKPELFDITPDDEQQMLVDAVRGFAADQVPPAARAADAACETPGELRGQAAELGLAMLGVPEEAGGVMVEQAATTTVLMAEALAHGDLGIAY